MGSIKDFDKEYELYEISLNKKAKDIFKEKSDSNQEIRNLNEYSLVDKLYRIMKFGGNMMYNDYSEYFAEQLDDSNKNVALFSKCFTEYLSACGIGIPLDFEKFIISEYFLHSLIDEKWIMMRDLNYDKNFTDAIITDLRREGVIKDGKLDTKKLKEWNETSDYFYLQGHSNELMSVYRKPSLNLEKFGIFFMKVPYDYSDEAIYDFSVSLCNFLEKVMKKGSYKQMFVDKIEHLFNSLLNSKNPECRKVMNESLVQKAKDYFFNDVVKKNIMRGVDALSEDIDTLVDTEYNNKIEELKGSSSDRDLVSGLLVVNKILSDIGDTLKWKAQVLKVSDSDSVYFGNTQADIRTRASMFVEERFISSRVYRRLKRVYGMIKNHSNHNELYFTKIFPEYPIMSNKARFKYAFVTYEGSSNLNQEESKDLCYMILDYMRENLDKSEWRLVEDNIKSLLNK